MVCDWNRCDDGTALIKLQRKVIAFYVALVEYCIGRNCILMKNSRLIHQFLDVSGYKSIIQWVYGDGHTPNLHCEHVGDVTGPTPIKLLDLPAQM